MLLLFYDNDNDGNDDDDDDDGERVRIILDDELLLFSFLFFSPLFPHYHHGFGFVLLSSKFCCFFSVPKKILKTKISLCNDENSAPVLFFKNFIYFFKKEKFFHHKFLYYKVDHIFLREREEEKQNVRIFLF